MTFMKSQTFRKFLNSGFYKTLESLNYIGLRKKCVFVFYFKYTRKNEDIYVNM